MIVSMVKISGVVELEKKLGKKIRRRGQMVASPTAKSYAWFNCGPDCNPKRIPWLR